MKSFLKRAFIQPDNQIPREVWVAKILQSLPKGASLLDAGCGTQRYRNYCKHLDYKAQDFGEYDGEGDGTGMQEKGFSYGKLDYTCDIWDIPEKDNTFDAVLCTEVIEHIPYPAKTIKELARLLKPGGILILTAPFACLPHFNPFFFFSGFSKEFYEKFCNEAGLEIIEMGKISNHYGFVLMELWRGVYYIKNPFIKAYYILGYMFIAPLLKGLSKVKTEQATMLHQGYLVKAIKRSS